MQLVLILGLTIVVYWGVRAWLDGESEAHALPEFAERTGEPCATCHVNPGGGGPRTLRGLLWSARGRPDQVPQLPGMLIAPQITDGLELYDIACAGCHGFSGEGLFAIKLAGQGISQAAARSFIRDGIPELDMPAFGDRLTAEQLDSLAAFVAELGEGPPIPREFLLPSPEFICQPTTDIVCGGK